MKTSPEKLAYQRGYYAGRCSMNSVNRLFDAAVIMLDKRLCECDEKLRNLKAIKEQVKFSEDGNIVSIGGELTTEQLRTLADMLDQPTSDEP